MQGKAALDRLMRDVNSPYFPTKHEDVIVQFQNSPLARARVALVRNFVLMLVKALLREDLDRQATNRYIAALIAVRSLYHNVVEQTLTEHISDLIRQLDAPDYWRAAQFLFRVPDVGAYIGEDVVHRMVMYIEQLDVTAHPDHLYRTLDDPLFRDAASARIGTLSPAELQYLVAEQPREEILDRALALYAAAENFNQANAFADTIIIPLVPLMILAHAEVLFLKAGNNPEVWHSYQFPKILEQLRENPSIAEADFQRLLLESARMHPFAIDVVIRLFDENHFRQLLDSISQDEPETVLFMRRRLIREIQQSQLFSEEVVAEIQKTYLSNNAESDE
jgi:hypothetical protein